MTAGGIGSCLPALGVWGLLVDVVVLVVVVVVVVGSSPTAPG